MRPVNHISFLINRIINVVKKKAAIQIQQPYTEFGSVEKRKKTPLTQQTGLVDPPSRVRDDKYRSSFNHFPKLKN
jgi:hypothetical protein